MHLNRDRLLTVFTSVLATITTISTFYFGFQAKKLQAQLERVYEQQDQRLDIASRLQTKSIELDNRLASIFSTNEPYGIDPGNVDEIQQNLRSQYNIAIGLASTFDGGSEQVLRVEAFIDELANLQESLSDIKQNDPGELKPVAIAAISLNKQRRTLLSTIGAVDRELQQ